MRLLFIHQNFPAQFAHLAQALVAQGHEVVALGVTGQGLPGVRMLRYEVKSPVADGQLSPHVPLLEEVAVKTLRAQACAQVMQQLAREGFAPDIVIAHPGWGEALFVKDVWPDAPLLAYLEFFYHGQGSDVGFDPEWGQAVDTALRMKLRMRNTVLLQAMAVMDRGVAPTNWQRSQLPAAFRSQTSVVFDGIDTRILAPNPQASVSMSLGGRTLGRQDSVITYVSRNLEPYRGCHIFFRALPQILRDNPQATVVVVGREGNSYSMPVPAQAGLDNTWKALCLREVEHDLPSNWRERVIFAGWLERSALTQLLQISACHLYWTYPFVLSWSLLEAMTVGCTVLASDTAPVREVIDHGQQGLLLDFFDAAAWAKQVKAVLDDPAAYAHLGVAARERVVQRYDLMTQALPAQISLINAMKMRVF
jgi:glycosyltransferase involved in cell wall biosynthesis